jgi:cytochrome c oxidase assembly protein subunit 15
VHLVDHTGRRLGLLVLGLTGALMYLGTIVTGSGPHAGDAHARRTGLDPRLLSVVHGWAVLLLVLATGALWLRTAGRSRQAVGLVLVVQAAQGFVGWAQYATGLPRLTVGVHMLTAGLLVVVTVRMVLGLRLRPVIESSSPSAGVSVTVSAAAPGAAGTPAEALPGIVHS